MSNNLNAYKHHPPTHTHTLFCQRGINLTNSQRWEQLALLLLNKEARRHFFIFLKAWQVALGIPYEILCLSGSFVWPDHTHSGEGLSALIFLGWIFLLAAMLGTYAHCNIGYAKSPLLSQRSNTAKYDHARCFFVFFLSLFETDWTVASLELISAPEMQTDRAAVYLMQSQIEITICKRR